MALSSLPVIPMVSEMLLRPHVCGIGGIGMSGVALLLLDMKCNVTGSDLRRSEITDLLEQRGVRINYSPSGDVVRGASCVIAPASFPKTHPELEAARNAGIPVLDRVDALIQICRAAVSEVCLCFGTVSRAKLARLCAGVKDMGWCAGAAVDEPNALPHARLGNKMVLDMDERDFCRDVRRFYHFPVKDIIVSDWQTAHYGYYSSETSMHSFCEKVMNFTESHRNAILPSAKSTRERLVFDVYRYLKPPKSVAFDLDVRDNIISFPKGWHREPMLYEGTCVDAAALAASMLWCRIRNAPLRSADIPCVGWFRELGNKHFHEIRMHPVNIDIALDCMRIKAGTSKAGAVIRPFASTLYAYSQETWIQLFKKVDKLLIIMPPYEGCKDSDCEVFAEGLRQAGIDVLCVSNQQAHRCAVPDEYWLWIGASDIL